MPIYELDGQHYDVPEGTTLDELDALVSAAPAKTSSVEKVTNEWNAYPGYVKSALRGGALGVAGLPNLIADTAVRGSNALGLSGVPEQGLPSARFKKFLDQIGLSEQPGLANQLLGMTGETLGGMYGTPGIGTAARAMPGRQTLPAQPTAQEYAQWAGLQAGYKLPPTSVKRTPFGNILESLTSPTKLAEEMTTDNQLTRNALMRNEAGDFETLRKTQKGMQWSGDTITGMRPDEVITRKGLTDNISAIWDATYKPLIDKPINVPTRGLMADISSIIKNTAGSPTSPMFREDIAKKLTPLIRYYKSDDLLQTVKALRSEADDIARSSAKKDTAMATALSDAANALEDRMAGALQQRATPAGPNYNDFVAGRQQMAKLATIRDATLDPTGNVDAAKLANRIKKGLPTTGNPYTSGMFSANFPKVSGLSQNAETELFDRISPGLGVSWIGGIAQAVGSPARRYLRSENYQTLLRRPGMLDTEKRMLLSTPGSLNNIFGPGAGAQDQPE